MLKIPRSNDQPQFFWNTFHSLFHQNIGIDKMLHLVTIMVWWTIPFYIKFFDVSPNFLFCQGFLHRHWRFTRQHAKGGDHFYSTLPLPPQHWGIYLQHCIWNDYHVFSITALVFTRLLLDEIYHHIQLLLEWLIDDAICLFLCLLDELILAFFYSHLTLETSGFDSHRLSPL